MQLGLRQSINQKQTQNLVITPKLRQAIEVLLMSRLDLAQHLQMQLEENPMLEELIEELDEVEITDSEDTELVEDENNDKESDEDAVSYTHLTLPTTPYV